jgi:tRNA 2-thiouridine synthesizing protein C
VWLLFFLCAARQRAGQGRAGCLLATSALTEEIGVFFVGDGVFQLLPGQQPQAVLARDYIATFKVLPLYDIETVLAVRRLARERGLNDATPWVVDANAGAGCAARPLMTTM